MKRPKLEGQVTDVRVRSFIHALTDETMQAFAEEASCEQAVFDAAHALYVPAHHLIIERTAKETEDLIGAKMNIIVHDPVVFAAMSVWVEEVQGQADTTAVARAISLMKPA